MQMIESQDLTIIGTIIFGSFIKQTNIGFVFGKETLQKLSKMAKHHDI